MFLIQMQEIECNKKGGNSHKNAKVSIVS